ncbi:hypothetical protein RHECNPAF_750063 [Rhizobium etli CNPAF512]|nr:hypothetical protein RHECNPAF_750063 [Rhizobium etli CNPAF512]
MLRHQARRRRGGGRTAGIADALVLRIDMGKHPFEEGVDERPCAHVLRLFLTPDHFGIAEARQLVDERLGRERIKLFDAQQVDVVDTALFALFEKIVIDLAGAHDDAADLAVLLQLDRAVLDHLGIIPEQAVEGGFAGQLGQRRDRPLVAQQRLRRHQDQRLAEVALQLPAQDVEVVRRRRDVGDLHVVFRAKLQEAFQASRGVLRTLALIAVRQQADEARHAQPLAFARRDELVEDHLRAVGEIAELGFPKRQRIRAGERVTIFETEDGLFRKHRIDDFVTGLRRRQVGERDVAFFGLLIVENRVALRESAAFAILSGQTDLVAFDDERSERKRFRHRPVEAFAALDHVGAVFHETLDRAMGVEACRDLGELAADLLQRLHRHGGLAAALFVLIVGRAQAGPLAVQPVGLVRLVVLAGVEFLFEMGAPVGLHLLDFAVGDEAFAHETLRIELQHRLVAADDLVHFRLREGRLVAFVVAVAAVAEHVEHHRLVELHAEFGRDLGGVDDGFRVVAVDVQDRRLDHLGDVGWVGRRTREGRVRGETDLVVDDDVHRAGDTVATQTGQTENFRNDALAGEGRVAVDQKRQNLGAFGQRNDVAFPYRRAHVLLGASLAHDDRVDDFEMRRICRQGNVHLVAVEFAVGGSAKMVLDVAGTFDFVGRIGAALELVEDGAVRLAHHLGEHVQTAAMGHAEHSFLQAEMAAALQDLFERGDQRFTAVETEALGALELDVEELLVTLGFDELGEDRLLAFGRESHALVWTFDALLDPGLLLRIGDVHEFDAERRAVGPLEDLDHLADGRVFKAEHVVDKDLAVVVGSGEAVIFRRQLMIVVDGSGDAERIELGVQMAAHAIGADHHDGADRIACRLQHVSAVGGLARGFGLRLHLGFDRLFDDAPIAIESRHQIAAGRQRPVLLAPGSSLGCLLHIGRILLQRLEEGAPLIVDRCRILFVARIELLDIGRVRAIQKRGDLKLLVGFLPCHGDMRTLPSAS